MRLKTVRAKLIALVSLSGLVLLAALPVLFWALRAQLIEQADDRIDQAQNAFDAEGRDSLADLRLAADVLSGDPGTKLGIASRDAAALAVVAKSFANNYPNLDILFVAADGVVIAQNGCPHPPLTLSELPELTPALEGTSVHGVTLHGCDADPGAPPAHMIAEPVSGGGAIVVCLPLDTSYLDNARLKFGLELAIAPAGSTLLLAKSTAFPAFEVPPELDTKGFVTAGDRRYVVLRFEPKWLRGPKESFGAVAVLDITEVYVIVRRNLIQVVAVLLVAAAISVWVGWRLASVMSRALRRVNVALKKLEKHEYVHVEATRTGDELEDLATGFNTMVDGLKERDNMRTTFGKYMTASVMAHLLSGKVHLGGVSMKVTILFSDIRGFTTISEKMDAQALVGLLNEYFTEMVTIVGNEDGVVDKYIGDAIMAVFGAPVQRDDDPLRAVRAAVRMRQALALLNVRLTERGVPTLNMGVGIHTGVVVAGNIGSESRMEYTVIGDAVNLASRLESNTKELGVNILISEDTYELTKHAIEARAVREIKVKGRKQAVVTYEVLGLKGEPLLPGPELSSQPQLPPAPEAAPKDTTTA